MQILVPGNVWEEIVPLVFLEKNDDKYKGTILGSSSLHAIDLIQVLYETKWSTSSCFTCACFLGVAEALLFPVRSGTSYAQLLAWAVFGVVLFKCQPLSCQGLR